MSVAPLVSATVGASRDIDVARDLFVEAFRRTSYSRETGPLASLRRAAIDRFAESGFPTVKNEDWKYTSVAPIVRARFEPRRLLTANPDSVLPQLPFGGLRGPRLVFVDGEFSREHSSVGSLPRGVKVETMASALERDPDAVALAIEAEPSLLGQPFAALNTAFFHDGAFVQIEPGVILGESLQIFHVLTDAQSEALSIAPRVLVRMGDGAQAKVIETFVGSQVLGGARAPVLTNAVTQLSLGQGAVLEHTLVQLQAPHAFHIHRIASRQASDSRLCSNFASVGGAWVRNEIHAVLAEKGAECTLNGFYMARDRQHVDNHTLIDHAAPNCSSRELYKGILDGSARAAFTGKVLVRQDSQKTAAAQSNKNLLLSDTATVNSRPQLQIYADDVKCSHGATVGKLDEEAVFYLRSRGIPRVQARRMLTEAFGVELFERLSSQSIRDELAVILRQWLGGMA